MAANSRHAFDEKRTGPVSQAPVTPQQHKQASRRESRGHVGWESSPVTRTRASFEGGAQQTSTARRHTVWTWRRHMSRKSVEQILVSEMRQASASGHFAYKLIVNFSSGPRCKFTIGRQNQDRSRLSTNHRRRCCDRSRPVLHCNAPLLSVRFLGCVAGTLSNLSERPKSLIVVFWCLL